jgi:PAS domain S-box-containing protein
MTHETTHSLSFSSDVLSSQHPTEADQYKAIIAAMQEGLVVQDAQGTILQCNAAAERILGLTVDQMRGRTSLDPRWRSIHEDGSPFPGETHPAMVTLRTGQPQHQVIMGVHKPDGALTWISINSQPLFQPGQSTPSAAVTTFTDITQQVEYAHRLEDSESRFRQMAENIEQVFWLYDADARRMIYVSPAYEHIWELSPAQLFADPTLYLQRLHPEDQERFHEQVSEQHLGSIEYRLIMPDGTEKVVRSQSFPVKNAQGKVYRIAGLTEDITERKRLEHLKRQQVAEEQKTSALRQFLRNASHDLKTPLTSMTTSLYLMRRITPDDPARLIRHLDNLEDQVTRVTTLLEDMFNLLRLDLSATFAFQVYDLNTLVRDAVDRKRPKAIAKSQTLEVLTDPQVPPVNISVEEMEQALRSLLLNAIAYTPEQGTIRLRVYQEGEYACVDVADTGVGISPEHLPHIFDRFYRVDSARGSHAGSGLGLTIARQIIEAHHGTLTVESTVGQGSRFTIRLPHATAIR